MLKRYNDHYDAHMQSQAMGIFPTTYNKSSSDNLVLILVSIFILFLINFSYFLCQFMNPGIRNPSKIP
jgi:hypothetical protein